MRLQLNGRTVLLLSAGLGSFASSCLLTYAALRVPTLREIEVVAERRGIYVFYRGHVGSSPYTTLDGTFIHCSVSIASSSGQCSIAPNGSLVRVGFARLPTLFSTRDVVMKAHIDGKLIYDLTPQVIRLNWIRASLWDAFFCGGAVAVFAFALLNAFNRGKADK
jgi:hypothetical protein